VLTIGQTFVIATGGIDLAVASTMTLAAIVLGEFYAAGWNIWAAALAGLAAAVLVGVLNGLIISKGGITDFIVTLGTLSAASGLALIIADGEKTTIVEPVLLKLSVNGIWIFSWSVLIAIGLALLAHVVLFHTRFGLHVLAHRRLRGEFRSVGIPRGW
jgi:ribose transport system permease protein